MINILIIFAILVIAVAAIMTCIVIFDVNKKIKHYELTDDSIKNEIERSANYESESLKTSVKSLSWIYIVICIILAAVSVGFVLLK